MSEPEQQAQQLPRGRAWLVVPDDERALNIRSGGGDNDRPDAFVVMDDDRHRFLAARERERDYEQMVSLESRILDVTEPVAGVLNRLGLSRRAYRAIIEQVEESVRAVLAAGCPDEGQRDQLAIVRMERDWLVGAWAAVSGIPQAQAEAEFLSSTSKWREVALGTVAASPDDRCPECDCELGANPLCGVCTREQASKAHKQADRENIDGY